MQIIKDENFKLNNTVVTLGKFDGNHLGHKSLFKEALRIKEESKDPLETVIFTFDVNPKAVLSGTVSEALYTNAERFQIEEGEGIDYVIVWPFTKENMSTSPKDFVREVLYGRLGTKHIVVGEDFRFGKDRSGDVKLLYELEEEFGFKLHVLSKVKYKGEDISSTAIKRFIRQGDLKDANAMLGRPFAVSAQVVRGKHLGRKLGFPTINFEAPIEKVIPPDGVYATKTLIDGKAYLSMTNIGTRPTFEEAALRNIETNIFDFDGDIYGENATVEFYGFIRPEKHFGCADELIKELRKNKEQIREFFKNM